MKRLTLEKHTQIANDIMYYIYTHIDTHIESEELSHDMGVSKFHMQRLFKEIFGKNIYESVKSIRLQKAANLLLTNKYSTISEIANDCGYSSHSSFIKAFRHRFGMPPKEWRENGHKLYADTILQQSKFATKSKAKFNHISPQIVKMPIFESYYIRNLGYNSASIKKTWQKMQTWVLGHNITDYTQIGLLHDNPTITPLNDCQYIACIVLPKKTEIKSNRLPIFNISSGVYAKFDLQGTQGDMLKFFHWVYHEWLIESEYETTTKPSYVIYHKNNFLSKDKGFDISFYLSIRF